MMRIVSPIFGNDLLEEKNADELVGWSVQQVLEKPKEAYHGEEIKRTRICLASVYRNR